MRTPQPARRRRTRVGHRCAALRRWLASVEGRGRRLEHLVLNGYLALGSLLTVPNGNPDSGARVTAALNETVIRRFYDRLWNRWELELADEIVSPDIRFRGSLGTELTGIEAFRDYVRDVHAAFPDWHNRIDELIVAGDRVVARLTWSGTHRGDLLGVAPTGRFVTYVGAAIFRLRDGRIEEGWVVGDTQELWRALGRL